MKRVPAFLPFTGVSTLLQKHYNKKQEIWKGILKFCGWKYPQGTYTHKWLMKRVLAFLPFTGVNIQLTVRWQIAAGSRQP